MCLLVLAWQAHPRYRLIVAANRDEYHERAAAPVARWAEPPGILAGRDLKAGGTWLGIDPARRFGVVTNFRELQPVRAAAPSRGSLIPHYLSDGAGAADFLHLLEIHAAEYSGFNLLLADRHALWYASNRAQPFARELPPGVYGLSNELLDTPWPKLVRVKRHFQAWLDEPGAGAEGLFDLLADRTRTLDPHAPPAPTGGLPREWAQILSAPFVVHPTYGTRCSTALLLEPGGAVYLAERRFDPAGARSGETEFRLNADEWPHG